MNDKQTENFIRPLKEISLDARERTSMREQLLAYTEAHPMPAKALPSPFWSVFASSPLRYALSALLIFGTLGGVTYAAEDTVPGDILYAVKVSVTEPAVQSLAVSEQAKAKWQATRAERRLSEAVRLAAEDKLDADTSTYLAREFEKAADSTEDIALKLETDGQAEAALAVRSDLEARLSAHATLLSFASEVEFEMNGNDDEIRAIAMEVSERVEVATEEREDVEAVVAIAMTEPAPTEEDVAALARTTMTLMAEPAANDEPTIAAKVAEVAETVVEVETVREVDPARAAIEAQTAERIAKEVRILINNDDITERFREKLRLWKEMHGQIASSTPAVNSGTEEEATFRSFFRFNR
jgi:hypothetical protein